MPKYLLLLTGVWKMPKTPIHNIKMVPFKYVTLAKKSSPGAGSWKNLSFGSLMAKVVGNASKIRL